GYVGDCSVFILDDSGSRSRSVLSDLYLLWLHLQNRLTHQ
ncbi:unnamed protein product, partial [Brassica rapa subsp. trilocularis]